MKPFIDPAFWSDADVERLDASGKLTALWLVTNAQTNLLGVCGASETRYAFETGLDPKGLARAIEALPRALTRVGSNVFVRNFVRHQFGTGDSLKRNNFFKPLKRLFDSVRDPELKATIACEYPEFSEGLVEGLPRAPEAQGQDRKVRKGKEVGECRGEGDAANSNGAVKPGNESGVSPALPTNLDTPKFREAWEQYIAYRHRKRFKALLPESVAAQWKIMSAYGPDVSRLAIEQTIANGWQGVFPEKITERPRGQTFKEEAKEREAALHKAKLPGLNF